MCCMRGCRMPQALAPDGASTGSSSTAQQAACIDAQCFFHKLIDTTPTTDAATTLYCFSDELGKCDHRAQGLLCPLTRISIEPPSFLPPTFRQSAGSCVGVGLGGRPRRD
jgi:hypothetical protein